MKSTVGYLFLLALTATLPAQAAIMTLNGTAADADFTTLAVGDVEATALFPVIDNLQVMASSVAVPETQTLLMLGLGVMMLGALRRFKRTS